MSNPIIDILNNISILYERKSILEQIVAVPPRINIPIRENVCIDFRIKYIIGILVNQNDKNKILVLHNTVDKQWVILF